VRVLTLTNLYPNPHQPTRGTFNRRYLSVLARRHEVQVIAPIAWVDELRARRAGKPKLPADRRVVHDGIIVDHPRYFYPPKVFRGSYGRCYELSVARIFDRVVDELSPDLVFAPWAYPDGWAATRLAKRYGLPVVIKCHGSDVLFLDQHPSRRRPTVEAVRSADGVVAVSRHLGDRLLELGVKSERMRVLIDGVDQEAFCPGPQNLARRLLGLAEGPPVLLFVGNLVPVKGVDVLISACGKLANMGVAHRLVVIGDGPLKAMLQRQAESLGLRETVQFFGAIGHEDLPNWFRAADAFVLPSRSEGVPSVLLEASACDTPWVASAVGGVPEIAELGRSRLVRPESADDLADAIRETLARPPDQSDRSPHSHEDYVHELADFFADISSSARAVAHVGAPT
jgi:glycosyltransferase involved in cell wall biosynthesis